MSNYKFLTLIISLFTLICFTIKAYAITENQYLVINKLINEENIDKAFSDLKLMQKDEVKLSARSQILIGKIYLALEQPAKAFSFFEKATFTSVLNYDLAYAGMTETLRIAAMASAYDLMVIPHCSGVYAYNFGISSTVTPFNEFINLHPTAEKIVPIFGKIFG